MMSTVKFDVEQAIRDAWIDVASVVFDYYKEEGYELDAEEKREAIEIIKNIRIQG